MSDQVDLRPPVPDGDVLRQDRDPALPLQVVGVQDSLTLELRLAKLPALPQHLIDQSRLAMVHVGDDGNVAKYRIVHRLFLLAGHREWTYGVRVARPVDAEV